MGDHRSDLTGPPDVPAHRAGCLAWVQTIVLATASLAVWFVTTFVVLLPYVATGAVDFPTKRNTPSVMEEAVGLMLIIIYQVLVVLLVVSIVKTVRTAAGSEMAAAALPSIHVCILASEVRVKSTTNCTCRQVLCRAGYLNKIVSHEEKDS